MSIVAHRLASDIHGVVASTIASDDRVPPFVCVIAFGMKILAAKDPKAATASLSGGAYTNNSDVILRF